MSATVTSASSPTQQPSPAEHVLQLATGYIASISIYIAAKLGIADLLKHGPRTTTELAASTNTIEDRLYRVLRVLASVGVFREAGPRRFELTPAADSLRSDVSGSIRDMAIWIADPMHFRIYAEMMHSVKTGEITFDHLFGKAIFEYLPTDPETSESFNAAMTCFS